MIVVLLHMYIYNYIYKDTYVGWVAVAEPQYIRAREGSHGCLSVGSETTLHQHPVKLLSALECNYIIK